MPETAFLGRVFDFFTTGNRFLGGGQKPFGCPSPFPVGLTDKAGVPNCDKYRKALRCTCFGMVVVFPDVVFAGNQAGRTSSTSSRMSSNCQ